MAKDATTVAPQPTEYDEAVQNPGTCFYDPDLRSGAVETYPAGRGIPGMPWPRSGAFGQAYRVVHNGQQWGVKCFTRLHADQETRYRAISTYLRRAALPYTVDFDFQPRGIQVKGRWFPILKMEWIDGMPLNDYVARHLNSPARVARLSERWFDLVNTLEMQQIAHGDLQHGNVLVAGDELRIIDYDGMYVPLLQGQASHELGHRNYQHPERTEMYFDATLDHFSAWIIYLSLVALSLDPSLWQRTGQGDETLLFHADDFRAPERSPLLRSLALHDNVQLHPLADLVVQIARTSPQQIPPLDAQLVTQAVSRARASFKPGWLNGSEPTARSSTRALPGRSAPGVAPNGRGEPQNGEASWVLDHLEPEGARDKGWLPRQVWPDRLGILTQVATSGTLFYMASLGLVGWEWFSLWFVSTLGMMGVLLAYHYVTLPAFRARSDLLAARARLERDQRRAEQRLRKLDRQLQRVAADEQAYKDRLDAQDRALAAATANRLQAAHDDYAAAARGRFSDWRAAQVGSALAAMRLADHAIPGIGQTMIRRLARARIRSAADIGYERVRRVDGVGEGRAQVLVNWRQQMEAQVLAGLPGQPPAALLEPLGKKLERKRAGIDKNHQRNLNGLAQKRQHAERGVASRRHVLEPQAALIRRQQTQLVWQLSVVARDLSAYRTVRMGSFLRYIFLLQT